MPVHSIYSVYHQLLFSPSCNSQFSSLPLSSLLCNSTVLLYSSLPAFLYSHFLSPSHPSLSPTPPHSSFPLFLLPLPITPPHHPRLYNIRITAAIAHAFHSQLPPPSPSLSANRVSLLAGSLEEVRRVMGLSNSPTRRQAYTAYACFLCVS